MACIHWGAAPVDCCTCRLLQALLRVCVAPRYRAATTNCFHCVRCVFCCVYRVVLATKVTRYTSFWWWLGRGSQYAQLAGWVINVLLSNLVLWYWLVWSSVICCICCVLCCDVVFRVLESLCGQNPMGHNACRVHLGQPWCDWLLHWEAIGRQKEHAHTNIYTPHAYLIDTPTLKHTHAPKHTPTHHNCWVDHQQHVSVGQVWCTFVQAHLVCMMTSVHPSPQT